MSDLNILIVDDSVTMRRILVNTLGKIGYSNVIEATDGKDALAKMYSEKVDFIITDWNMPEMSGLEFVQSVRGDEYFKNIPILMVTTRSLKDDIITALKAGINNYVVKPFTPEVLDKKIKEILSKK
ncbi:two-component system response regulator [candidate division KSB1 bacterium]|nr:MAG: two-component system response regulator [candidate division KSB1 bacterium]